MEASSACAALLNAALLPVTLHLPRQVAAPHRLTSLPTEVLWSQQAEEVSILLTDARSSSVVQRGGQRGDDGEEAALASDARLRMYPFCVADPP